MARLGLLSGGRSGMDWRKCLVGRGERHGFGSRLLRRCRDYVLVRAENRVTGMVVREDLDRLAVDSKGAVIHKFAGGLVGLSTLATSMGEDSETVMEALEPFLLRLGFIERTPRGRIATRLSYEYLECRGWISDAGPAVTGWISGDLPQR